MGTDSLTELLTGVLRAADGTLIDRTWVHAGWVAVAMLLAIAVAIIAAPLASLGPSWERQFRRACDAAWSVPALAWLGICAALLDRGGVIACFLLACTAPPLVRGVIDGNRAVEPALADVAVALGLPRVTRIRIITVPMALPATFRGLRKAVACASAATMLAAVVGAGGYGELIIDGITSGTPSRALAGALAGTVFTGLILLALAAAEQLMPPLWGARVGSVPKSLQAASR